MTLYFAPEQDCLTPLLAALSGAQREVRASLYELTLIPLITALVSLHGAGKDVAVLLDHSQVVPSHLSTHPTSAPAYAALRKAGVPVLVGTSAKHQILHDKLWIIDGTVTAHGSLNATYTALNEGNTLEIVSDPQRAALMRTHWQRLWDWVKTNVAQPAESVGA